MRKVGFDALMHDACVVWGFCGCVKNGEALHVTMLLPQEGPVHAAQFVEWLLLADNVNPNLPKFERHKAALHAAFVAHMGSETVDARSLHWSDNAPEAIDADVKHRDMIEDGS